MRHTLSRLRGASRVVRPLASALPLAGALSLAAISLPVVRGPVGQASLTSAVALSSAGRAATSAAMAAHQTRALPSISAPSTARPALGFQVDFVTTSQSSGSTESVQQMIEQVFGPYAWQALNVARCESSFEPGATNPSSGAAGVFQFLASTWQGTSYAGYSPYDAWANINAAHEVFMRDGYSWREWSCQP